MTDISDVLDIQVDSPFGTFVENNPMLCMNPSLRWGSVTNSMLAYNLTMVCFVLLYLEVFQHCIL